MSEPKAWYRLKLGIRCPDRSRSLAADPETDAGLRRLLEALAGLPEPPIVVLFGCHPDALSRFPPAIAQKLAMRTVTTPLRPGQRWILTGIRRWLRLSNAVWNRWLSIQNQADACHETLTRAWRTGSRRFQVLALVGIFALWPAAAIVCMTGAVLWGLAFPLWMLDRVLRRVEHRLGALEAAAIRGEDCSLWLVTASSDWQLPDVPALVLRRSRAVFCGRWLAKLFAGTAAARGRIYWTASPASSRRQDLEDGSPRRLTAGTFPTAAPQWSDAVGWMRLFQQAIIDTPLALGLDEEVLAVWPRRSPPPFPHDRLRVLLMLQLPWRGGNWEHTRYLVEALDQVACRHGRVHLELAVHTEQTGLSALPSHLPVHRCRLHRISRSTAAAWSPEIAARLAGRPEDDFFFLSGAGEAALAADAWLALTDRFPLPLLPARPYAVVVHDMLHLHVPEAFHRAYFRNLAQGTGPTLRHADRIIVTSPGTRADVLRGYALDPKLVDLVPVACQPHRRFAHLPRGFVPLPRQDFLLNISNGSPHKGADLLLRAFALLKARLKEKTPLLVLCGVNTEYLSPSCDAGGPPYWHHCRRLVQELDLAEDRDVVFLGAVTDIELKDLYQRCQAVVHAARHDNGSYCLIEAAWFGKPVVSTRYPAVEFLVERFGLEDVLLVPLGDAAALAEGMFQARTRGPVEEARLARIRDHLLHPRFSFERYAEQVHELLVELASQGRSERQAAYATYRRADRAVPDSDQLPRPIPQASR